MTVYLLFIDGVGLGEKASYNPWYTEPTPGIHNILGSPLVREAAGRVSTEVLLLSTDACLGVEGLPQSATGQATIFTGSQCSTGYGRASERASVSTSQGMGSTGESVSPGGCFGMACDVCQCVYGGIFSPPQNQARMGLGIHSCHTEFWTTFANAGRLVGGKRCLS